MTDITLDKDGGFYYRALTVHYAIVAVLLLPTLIVLLLAVLNPFWFRDSFFNFVERSINKIVRWRDRIKYRVYLGTDPNVWHTLKDLK